MPDSPTRFCLFPDSGAGSCSLMGEDGDYLTETSLFGSITSGLATDSVTGLGWQTFNIGQTPSWMSLAEAVDFCTDGGLSVPTAVELISLLDLGAASGGPLVVSIPGETAIDAPYWTLSEACSGSVDPGTVVQLSFANGEFSYATGGFSSFPAYVRCVQPLTPSSPPTYTALDAGALTASVVFHDDLSGFDWAIVSSGTSFMGPNWFDALDACNALRDQDCTDWRLASYKELATLLPLGVDAGSWGNTNGINSTWTSTPVFVDAGTGTSFAPPEVAFVFQRQGPVDFAPQFSPVSSGIGPTTSLYCVRGP